MSTEELEKLRQELEARIRQLLKENPDSRWLEKALEANEASAADDESKPDGLDEFLADLNPTP